MNRIGSSAAYGRVAVLMGGQSAEREISLKSGRAVLDALLKRGIAAEAVDVGDDVLSRLAAGSYDRAFIILHGRGGEDGVIQGALQRIGMPYTGSGVLGSALAMDKYRTKAVWRGVGIPTPESVLILDEGDLDMAAALGFPLMMKPVCEGSSIGMNKVESRSQLRRAWDEAREFDSLVLAERWIVGEEYTSSILQGEALPMIRLETPHLFYDYEAKYSADTTSYHCPCGLDPAQESDLQLLCLKAFEAVGASGWGRVDLMLDGQRRPWLIEVNTVPGMTDHSLVPMAAKVAGMAFDELVESVLATSLGRGGDE
ncbi:MAG: D-alanine--D-alanine ligase [gamma proteobacterium symbiont of Ctena orbiculata]|nr:MAG: D-alanine--D-alanine ligase [gamma proteobacterium symbiont of Ctena orbiculata]PUB77800.1 MAG: D-alanine--D-alanine ligase [gamma proteobacterium symbiont of Ctena orbiculata]